MADVVHHADSYCGIYGLSSHTLSGPHFPWVWDDTSNHRAVWENQEAVSVSKDSFPGEQKGAPPQSKGGAGRCCPTLPVVLLLYECVSALAGFALSGGSGSALVVTSGGHLSLTGDKCRLFWDCFC